MDILNKHEIVIIICEYKLMHKRPWSIIQKDSDSVRSLQTEIKELIFMVIRLRLL